MGLKLDKREIFWVAILLSNDFGADNSSLKQNFVNFFDSDTNFGEYFSQLVIGEVFALEDEFQRKKRYVVTELHTNVHCLELLHLCI